MLASFLPGVPYMILCVTLFNFTSPQDKSSAKKILHHKLYMKSIWGSAEGSPVVHYAVASAHHALRLDIAGPCLAVPMHVGLLL